MSSDFAQVLWEKFGGEGPCPWPVHLPAEEVIRAVYAATGADGISVDVVGGASGGMSWEVTLRGEFWEWPTVTAPTLAEAVLLAVEAKPNSLRGSGGLITPDPGALKNPPSPRIPRKETSR